MLSIVRAIMFLELVKLNLNSDNRIACLEKEHEFYCGDGVVQVNIIFASYENDLRNKSLNVANNQTKQR